jgi:hypothetical protein
MALKDEGLSSQLEPATTSSWYSSMVRNVLNELRHDVHIINGWSH